MVRYEKNLIRTFINYNENMNEKSEKNHGGILIKLLISHLLITKLDIKVMLRHSTFT